MSQLLELPDEVYRKLLNEAEKTGVSPADWISERLPNASGVTLSEQERQEAKALLEQHIVSLGYPTGTDNESIDADLTDEYAGKQ
ncbi:MAG: hypothetical protein H0U81_09930 [Pyrinomonadaceae bacterium]|nr:hypothetical protein [Pyrinomonadaceae bacterium]